MVEGRPPLRKAMLAAARSGAHRHGFNVCPQGERDIPPIIDLILSVNMTNADIYATKPKAPRSYKRISTSQVILNLYVYYMLPVEAHHL